LPPESSTTVHFDQILPVVFSGPTQAPPANGYVDWHGTGQIRVTATDNHCLKSVTLNATMPSGRVLGPFPMTGPSGCPGSGTWTLDLASNPLATDEVGVVEYAVTAKDAFGNLYAEPRTLNLTVNDTQPAIPRFLRLEPPLVSPGTRSRVVAEVFENAGIDRVRVFFHRINPDRSYTLLGEGTARPLQTAANGTGEWVAETDTDLGLTNLTLGDYLWEVRPLDRDWQKTCPSPTGTIQCPQQGIILRVVNDAGIFIQQDAPAAGATFVNATPVFRFKVFDPNVTASGVTLRAGNSSGNLTTVQPTNVTDLPFVGTQRTGLLVEYRPDLANQTTFALQVEATSQGLVNRTPVLSYTVDAVPPVVSADVTGTVDLANRTYAVAATRVALNATDAQPTTLTYSVNGGAPQAYAGPITPSGADGEWRLDYAALDAAGNAASGTVRLTLDRSGPTVTVAKHGDDLLVNVADAGAGLNESSVRVLYAYGNATTFTPALLQKATGSSFRVLLPGNATATGLRYYFEAKDLLGNAGGLHSAASPYVIEPEGPPANLAPTLRVTLPAANAAVRDRVELRWLASDPEGEDLTITIAIRSPTGAGRIIQTAGPNNGTYLVDVSGQAAGTYTLVVTASDGEKTAQESVNFFVERGELVELVTPPPVQVEQSRLVPIGVRVNAAAKPIQAVTYTLKRDNETVGTGGMKASGNAYTANLVTGDPGRYAVLVSVEYADGTTEPQREVAAFTVTAAQTQQPDAAFVRWPR
ncbi:MAG TPA: hypothetical protein VNX21_05700, partial [Candidatus Thermoplasmatota archaeon]|nr:hypothetical protein [Candidatus Thermoplasmatota archaeon]